MLRLRIIPLLLALPVLLILLGLGRWQWQRAEEKQQMLDTYAQRQSDTPVQLDGRQTALPDILYRRVDAAGEYLPQQYLLDNQVLHHQAGYHVLTPLRLASGTVVLVNRGWVPVGEDRNRVTALPVPTGPVSVQGLVNHLPDVGLHLGEPDESADRWPKRVQYLVISRIEHQLRAQVLPYVIWLDPTQPGGFVREWRLLPAGPERHIAYAVQWFALALAWTVLVLTAQMRWSKYAH